jgi:transglutaminase-like putative cysteine protease
VGHPAQEDHTLPRSPEPKPSAYPTSITIGGHPYEVSIQPRVVGNGSMGTILYATKRIEVATHSALAGLAYAALALLLTALSWAAPARAEVPTQQVVLDARSIHIRRDLSFTEDHTRVVRILQPEAVEGFGKRRLSFSPSREELRIVEAWTRTPDGKRHVVPPDRIVTQQGTLSDSEAKFNDRLARVVLFPKVAVGSELHTRHIRTRRVPIFPGHYSQLLFWTPHSPHSEVRVDVLVDAGVALQLTARDDGGRLKGGRIAARPGDPAGSSRYRYTYAREDAELIHRDQVSMRQFGPMLVLGTFASWADVAKAYRARATPRVTPAITAKAREIVGSATSPLERVQRLHHWVSRNIRYISVQVDDGSHVPHPAQSVLDNGYGDCKDFAMLLEALLAAVGIEAGPVLIDMDDNYELPPQPTPFAFDHVIVHVPALDLYLDPTFGYARAGTLPFEAMAKPVLHVREGRIGRTPQSDPARDFTQTRLNLVMDASGAIRGGSEATMGGVPEVHSRNSLAVAYEEDGVAAYVARLFGRQLEPGTGSITADPGALAEPWVVRTTFTLEPVVNLPGLAALRIPLGLAPGRIQGLAWRRGETARTRPFYCSSLRHEETVVLEFPEGSKVEALPPPVDFERGAITYRARYVLEGRTLTSTRTYVARRSGPTCEPEEDRLWEAFRQVLVRDLRGQVFLR